MEYAHEPGGTLEYGDGVEASFSALILMIFYVLAGLIGLALGSFLNVVITRLPQGEQIWTGRSRCPFCHTIIAWYDNLPLVSYFWLQGHCRFCRTSIPFRYPVVELSGSLLILILWSRFHFDRILIAYVPFSMALLALSVIDLERRLLPDVITLPGIGLGLGLSLVFPHITFLEAASGSVLGGLLLYSVDWIYLKLRGKRGLGGGDVKLMAMIGAFLGPASLPLVIFLSAGFGSLAGFAMAVVKGRCQHGQWQSTSLPYGPFLSAGAFIYILAGENILRHLRGG